MERGGQWAIITHPMKKKEKEKKKRHIFKNKSLRQVSIKRALQ
jgi:hypothetical protein